MAVQKKDKVRAEQKEECARQIKSPTAGQLIGLNSGLAFKHALAVFFTRPQADGQIGAMA